jgi:hypothetical protein
MNKFPVEVVLKYLSLLDSGELLEICKTDKRLYKICKDNTDYICKKYLENLFNKTVDIRDALVMYKTFERHGLLTKKYKIPRYADSQYEILYPNSNFYNLLVSLSGYMFTDPKKYIDIVRKYIFKIFEGVVYKKHEVPDNNQQVYTVVFDNNIDHIQWLNKYFGKLLPKKEFYFLLDDPRIKIKDFNDDLYVDGRFRGYMRRKNESKFIYFET